MEKLTRYSKGYVLNSVRMRDMDLSSPFFISFIKSYLPYYYHWLEKKRNDKVLIVSEKDNIRGMMKLKLENPGEDYSDISPVFLPKRRLKISSFKVEPNDADISGFFMRTAFREALRLNTEEIYATLASNADYRIKLLGFLEKWGFQRVGIKYSCGLAEEVLAVSTDSISKDYINSIRLEHDSYSNKETFLRFDF